MSSTTGQRIRACRVGLGLTQRAVGDAIDITASSVAKIEAGRTPDISSALKLAELFGVSLDWLIAGVGEKRRKRAG